MSTVTSADLAPLARGAASSTSAGRSNTSLQALAVGLEHDRERRVARGDLQQVVRALPLHPERRALARPPARQQQRARRRLAEARGEEARAAQLAHHQLLDLLRLGQQVGRVGRPLALGQPHARCRRRSRSISTSSSPAARRLRLERDRPRRVHAAAPGRRAGTAASRPSRRACARARWCGRRAGRRSPRAGPRGRRAGSGRRARRGRARAAAARAPRRAAAAASSRVSRPIARPSSTGRAPRSAFQNGILPGSPGAGTTQHAVARDLGDAPARGAEDEDLAGAALEHHLLVELAHAPAAALARRPGRRRRGRGRGSCPRSCTTSLLRALARAHASRAAGPRRAAAAARRTRRTGSGRRACRGRPRTAARASAGEGRRPAHQREERRPPARSPAATIATSCCASTSSGFCGMRVSSTAPSFIALRDGGASPAGRRGTWGR